MVDFKRFDFLLDTTPFSDNQWDNWHRTNSFISKQVSEIAYKSEGF